MALDQKILTAPGDLLFARDRAAWWAPALRFVRFVYLVGNEFSRNRCPEKAAALGFETVLSFVPALVLSLFFIGTFGGLEGLTKNLPRHLLHSLNVDQISLTMPAPAGAPGQSPAEVQVKLSEKIAEIVEAAVSTLRTSSVSLTSLLGLIIAAIFLTLTLEASLNDIWSSHGRRSLFLRVATSWAMLTLAPFLLAVSLYLTQGMQAPQGIAEFALRMLGPLVTLYLLYWIVPAASVQPRAALLGSVVAAAAWVAARAGFGYYLQYAVRVDRLYGAIGLLPIFLIWVWVAWMIVLTGAEVCYTLQNLSRLTALERRRRLAPFVQPGLVALGVVLRTAEAFRDGKGAVPREELVSATGLSDALWERLSALLLDKRILIEAGRDGRGYSLGRPPDQLRVEEIISAVEDALVARPEGGWEDDPASLNAVSRQLVESRRRELGGKSVAQVLAERPRPAAPPQ